MAESISPLFDLEAAVAWREEQGRAGRRVVTTNGVFDLVHAGHVRYLAWARAQGDALLLLLNADESVRRLKGELRPIVTFADRATVVGALRSVDAIVGFAERTPEAALERLRPDVHVKSAQYRLEELPERHVVEAGGGVVVLAPHEAGRSTTDIVATIRGRS